MGSLNEFVEAKHLEQYLAHGKCSIINFLKKSILEDLSD